MLEPPEAQLSHRARLRPKWLGVFRSSPDCWLEDNGAVVTVTTTALAALPVLNERCPQVLVCARRLPDLDGKELLKQVRQAPATASRQLPAIAVTS